MNKKGYMRTIEALTAIVITFLFMAYVLPYFQGNEVRRSNLNIVGTVIHNSDFRNCVLIPEINQAEDCTKNIIAGNIPRVYEYQIKISSSRNFNISKLPKKKVFSESVMIAGNITNYSPRYVKIYYWLK